MADFLKYKIKDFYLHKDRLIDLINQIPTNKFDNISHTDWDLHGNIKREYVDYFKKFILNGFIDNLKTFLVNYSKIDITKFWFQVYKKNDFHAEHTHGRTHFTNVFYVQLPQENLKTKIKKSDGSVLDFNAEEGQIVTFPAYWRHSSPINVYDKDKIIISFNLDCE